MVTYRSLNHIRLLIPQGTSDLIEQAKSLCKGNEDNEDFTLPLYKVEESGLHTFIRLWNSRVPARSKTTGEMSVVPPEYVRTVLSPFKTPLRHLVRKPAVLDTHTEHLVDTPD